MATYSKIVEIVSGEITTVDLSTNTLSVGELEIGGVSISSVGQIAFFTGQVAGMATNVSIAANNPGTAGNISLSFDGSTTIAAAITAWNSANPNNNVTLTSGDNSQTPDNGTSIPLAGGSNSSGADSIGIFGTPVNFTPAQPNLQSYIEAIDAALAGVAPSGTAKVDTFTLSGTDITNKFVTLSFAPLVAGKSILLVRDAPNMFFGSDFTITGNQLSWNTLALDGILSIGDNLTAVYNT
jgi:hypothetical protein